MAKYTFIKARDEGNHFDKTTVIIEVDTDSLDDLLEGFQEFINGCGFSLKGAIDIIPEEED